MKIVFIVIASLLFGLNAITGTVAYRRGDLDPMTAGIAVTVNSSLTVFGILAIIFP